MSEMLRIMKKEVKEHLTIKTIIPIVAFTLLFVFIGQLGVSTIDVEEVPVVGLIDEDDSEFSGEILNVFEANSDVAYISKDAADIQEALEKMEEDEWAALIFIPAGFSDNINDDAAGSIEITWRKEGIGVSVPTVKVEYILQIANERLSRILIEGEEKVSADVILNPFSIEETTHIRGKELAGVSPGQVDQAMGLYTSLVPIIIMLILIMSGGQVIESMGLEKGNKTLETLLTLPVKRRQIALGKILGSALVGLILAAIYMAGFGYFQMAFQPEAIDLAALGLSLGLSDYLLLAISLTLTIIAGLAICMLLGAMSSDYRSSQIRIIPLLILVFIPFFLILFTSFHSLPLLVKIIMFIIPFSHPMMAIEFLMFNDYALVIMGIIYVTVFTALTITLVSHVFQSDTLITGKFNLKWMQKISKIING